MKLVDALMEDKKEGTPEAAVEYFRKPHYGMDKQGRANLAVKLNQLSILTSKTFTLKEFWDIKDESKLVEQFIKATLELGRTYGIIDNTKMDFENYQYVVDNLFGTKKMKNDITFLMEPGYNFKGLFQKEKFSISKIKHDDEEAKRGAWAHKEKKELEKLK